ncbi:ABC1 kinase family protein [Phaeobacter gallaeciensis]|uniref:Unusual protein kinase n=1 Tax=Phaeobacter gallaeciensis TaxID=60890 RepID=A0AAC9ZDY9_9RHOB|nr:AarF/ABC1/UbiB kinase family protein [Phaeobacter gallaeciensis]AHD11986.1 putative unusual protein kinase [Phaeobacter gallaeciensis DSM 26640]ATE95252.1 putative unusual protein kinase [Phaeobacter gallaeciensis]ATE99643.1 putative unusual protein kinase [Phaeobacter gallaeciensis]ATF03957.1 putative unusual protein kinase [Phaeobacter gallaeciensis]ATF08233.1 putative unusual protein kinase [Phaeobacter gallaeciensis]
MTSSPDETRPDYIEPDEIQPATAEARAVAVPSGRVSRLARIGGMAAQVAGNAMVGGVQALSQGQRPQLRDLLMTPANARRLTSELARMRGAAMKLGQLMSMESGALLPQELSQILSRLRAEADFMPPKQLRQVLDAAWGEGWRRQFLRFDVRPMAAASIGQVHRAQLRDGREMAIKVQYPGVARSIDSDVANLGSLLRASRLVPGGFDIAPYLEEARRQLHEEVDYDREGRYLADFAAQLNDQPQFQVPEFYPDWSTDAVLAMAYAKGRAVEDAQTAPQEVRDRLMRDLMALMLRELFEFGLMQSDPNFANYLFDAETGRIVLLDFGATRPLAPQVVAQYRALLRAGMRGDAAALTAAAADLGLVAPDGMADEGAMRADHQRRVLAMITQVFDVLRTAKSYDFADPSLLQQMQAEGMALAEEGMVPPAVPMDVLFVQRKLAGMVLLAGRLGARVPVRALLSPYLEDD